MTLPVCLLKIYNFEKTKETKILNTFQVLTDDEVSDALDSEYKVSPLNSVMINDEMVMFYEVDLREFVKV